MSLHHWLLGAIAASILSTRGADFPDLVFPNGVGVNIHFTSGHERDLDLIAAAGFKFIRMDFGWASTERHKAEYSWEAYDTLSAGLEKRGLRPIFILDYSNDLYEPGASPQHPESVAAFARWAAAAASHFKGHRVVWEIWNEPNIDFWKPKPDVHQYIALAKATCQAVRQADPQATIVGPASSEFPWPFLEEICKSGLLADLDAISVHPYRDYGRTPETPAADFLRLRALIEKHAPANKRTMPILSGEWGYSSHRKGVSVATQAAFLERQQLANVLAGVPISIWYDWKNDGNDPAENEHNFGTVLPDLSPKPAYQAIQTLTRELAGFRIAHRIDVGNSNAFVLLLVNDLGIAKLAAWSATGEQTVQINSGLRDANSITAIDGTNTQHPLSASHGLLSLPLSEHPIYVRFGKSAPELEAATRWRLLEPIQRSIVAGTEQGLKLALEIRNPSPTPTAAHASMSLEGKTITRSLQLAPKSTNQVALTGTVSRRDHARFTVPVWIQTGEPTKAAKGGITELVDFAVANPLQIRLAPVQAGLSIELEQSGPSSFDGMLELAGGRSAIALTAANPRVSIIVPGNTNSAAGFSGPARVFNKSGTLVAETPGSSFRPIQADSYKARLDGDAKIPATANLTRTQAPNPAPPYQTAFALDYDFAEGWRFVRCEASQEFSFPKRPSAIGVWVFGDESGNALRIRLRDSQGQTFQPTGPNLNWTGWRWVTFDLTRLNESGHWGGANDGVPRGDLTLDTPLLVDGSRHKTSGRIFFAGFMAID